MQLICSKYIEEYAVFVETNVSRWNVPQVFLFSELKMISKYKVFPLN